VTELLLPPPTVAALRDRPMIPSAVLHLANDQPLLVDLFGLPSPTDPVLMCTNVRSLTGKRPVWADHVESVYYFPWLHVRFLEIPPGAAEVRSQVPALTAGPTSPLAALDPDPDLEIDEEFLRRVREA
jgi:hypothetical protein